MSGPGIRLIEQEANGHSKGRDRVMTPSADGPGETHGLLAISESTQKILFTEARTANGFSNDPSQRIWCF
jgi:hypothetical protein